MFVLVVFFFPSHFNIPGMRVYISIMSFVPAALPVINLMVHLIVDGVLGMKEVEPPVSSCLDHRHHLTTFTDPPLPPDWTNILIKVLWCVASTDIKKKKTARFLSTPGHILTLHQTTKSHQVLNIDKRGVVKFFPFFFWVYSLTPFMFTVSLFQDFSNPSSFSRSPVLMLKGGKEKVSHSWWWWIMMLTDQRQVRKDSVVLPFLLREASQLQNGRTDHSFLCGYDLLSSSWTTTALAVLLFTDFSLLMDGDFFNHSLWAYYPNSHRWHAQSFHPGRHNLATLNTTVCLTPV